MKKLISILLVVVILSCTIFSTITANAASTFINYKVKVTSATYLRERPITSAVSVRKVAVNTILKITSVSGDWGRATYGGQTGWIDLKYTNSSFSLQVPMVKQTKSNTCGSASGVMALKRLGKTNVTEMQFWNRANANGEGTYVYRVGQTLNYYLGSSRYTWKNHSNSNIYTYYNVIQNSLFGGYPVIIPLKYSASSEFGWKSNGHYVVVKRIYVTNDICYVTVNDPYKGAVITLPLTSLMNYNKAHSGYIIYHA